MKRLIINADDFGLASGANRGIIELYQAGVVSSTSCMTNMPAWTQAAGYLREHPELGAGVHLVFSEGRPVLPGQEVPALVGVNGEFLGKGEILRSVRRGTTAQLRAEYRAQIERFVSDTGRPPDHIDSHSSISYVRPDRGGVALEVALEYDLPMRIPFGDDLDDQASGISRVWGYPTWTVRLLGGRYRNRMDRAGVRRPNCLIQGFSPSGPRTVEQVLRLLDTARDGWISEFLSHPGYDGDWREEEQQVLLDPKIRERLRGPDIELVTFAAV